VVHPRRQTSSRRGSHLFQGGQVGAGNAAYGNLGLFLIIGVRHQVPVFHHLNPTLAVLDDAVMEALLDDLSGQGEIVQPLVFQKILNGFPAQCKGKLKSLN